MNDQDLKIEAITIPICIVDTNVVCKASDGVTVPDVYLDKDGFLRPRHAVWLDTRNGGAGGTTMVPSTINPETGSMWSISGVRYTRDDIATYDNSLERWNALMAKAAKVMA